MTRLGITAVLALAMLTACGVATPVATTVAPTPTSTSISSTTTTSVPTTTTPTITTTTTIVPTSTSTTLLEGNWADVPVVTSSIGNTALGWWDGEAWVQLMEGDSIPVRGGEDYQVVLDGSTGMIQGSERVEGCAVLDSDFPGIELSDPESMVRHIEDDVRRGVALGVAISAGWGLRPRPVTDGETHPDIEGMAVSLLTDRGFDTDRAEIVQVVDADLDGDGAIETLVAAEDTQLGNEVSGVYSIVFVVSPAWEGAMVIDESVIPASESGYPASLRIPAVADLNGDGSMEVVVDAIVWEGSSVIVNELTKSGFTRRLSAGCGV